MLFSVGTEQEFEKVFDSEETAKKFLFDIRWADGFVCPRCGHKKGYPYKKEPTTLTCGNMECKRQISLKQGSFIENTKLPYKEWLRVIFLYIKTKGRFVALNYMPSSTFVTCYMVDVKLKEIFYNVHKDYGDVEFLFREACRQVFIITEKRRHFLKRQFLNTHIISPVEIIDFNDNETYRRIIFFITKEMYYAISHRFIFYAFCSPEDIMAECFIAMAESEEVGVVNGELLIDILRRTQYRMWKKHVQDTPNLAAWYRAYSKGMKEIGRRNMCNWYLKQLIASGKARVYFKSILEIKEQERIIQEKRAQLSEKRKKVGYSSNIEFDLNHAMPPKEMKDGRVINYDQAPL